MNALKIAKIHNFDRYISFYSDLSLEEAEELCYKFKAVVEKKPSSLHSQIDYFFGIQGGYLSDRRWAVWSEQLTEKVNRLRQFVSFSEEFEQPLYVGAWYDENFAFLHMGNPEKGIIICHPEKYIDLIAPKDYSNITPAELRESLSAPRATDAREIIPVDAENSLTTQNLQSALTFNDNEISSLKQTMDDVRHAKTGELAELKAQIETMQNKLREKQEKLMAELSEKKREMEETKYRLEGQIYLLDSQIYAIRCYAGEVVTFAQIRKGEKAPVSEPIIVHQKLRFLDEELGRLASLYNIQWDEIPMFEQFLRHSPLALDTFAPNKRCVMLVRLSRTGKHLSRNDDAPYANLIDAYDYYHGKTVGIIIRNGENLWLGWTDEKRVHIDDDLILSQAIEVDTAPDEEKKFRFESEKEAFEAKQREQRKKILDGLVSRTFIYNILQGIVDKTDILPLPSGVKLSTQSKYVKYAVADAWIADSKYGSFTKIVERCNQNIAMGDMLLTCQHLTPEYDQGSGRTAYAEINRTWHNSRGRGERNRTHDCHVDDCTIYKANLVEYDPPVAMVRYKVINTDTTFKGPFVIEAELYTPERFQNSEILEKYETDPVRHVFVSVEKTDTWYYGRSLSTKPARANFEVYSDEIINLTYMNSCWLEWVINSKELGHWSIGGSQVDFAYAIRYLKKAMDHIKARELEEKKLLDAVDPSICANPEWQVQLSEWKIEKKVRVLTPYQAKRFAKYIEEKA